MSKHDLPTLQELHHDGDLAIKNDALKQLLNNPPPQQWIKAHPFAKSGGSAIPYLPIGRIEGLMDKIFQEWRVEVISYNQLFNSVTVHVRVHYRNPIDGEWRYHDGVGAMGVQTNKGASASDLSAIKQDAIMKALPAAKSYAIKDACDHLGNLFGRNLTRAENYDMKQSYTPTDNGEERKRVIDWLKAGKMTFEQLIDFKESTFTKYEDDQEITELVIKLEATL
jgi:hypothetical protein